MNCCCSNPVCREKGCQAQQQFVHQQHPQTYSNQCPTCQDKVLVINYSERLLIAEQERDDWKLEYENLCKFANQYEEQRDRYKSALKSIAKNSCCDQCQEAKKVALEALQNHRT